MQVVQKTSIYTSWGEPFDQDDLKKVNDDLRVMFDDSVTFMVKESDDGFEVIILKESDGHN